MNNSAEQTQLLNSIQWVKNHIGADTLLLNNKVIASVIPSIPAREVNNIKTSGANKPTKVWFMVDKNQPIEVSSIEELEVEDTLKELNERLVMLIHAGYDLKNLKRMKRWK